MKLKLKPIPIQKLKLKIIPNLNQILVVALTAVILSGFVFSLAGTGALTRSKATPEEVSECQQIVRLPQVFHIISTADCCGETPNSLQAFMMGLGSGAGCLEVNVVFNDEGEPVLAPSQSYVTDYCVTLEQILQVVHERDYLCILINLIEFTNVPRLFQLIIEYDLVKNVYVSQINKEHMPYLISQMADVKYVFDVDESLDLNDAEVCKNIVSDAFSSGASVLKCSTKGITQSLVDAIRNFSPMQLFLTEAQTQREMYRALSFNPDGIMTTKPDELLDLIVSNDFFDR